MKLLKKARNIRKKVLDINELNESNKNDYDDVFSGKLDYLLIKNFIPKSELSQFNNQLNLADNIKNNYREHTKSGFFLGYSLLEANSISDYFVMADKYNAHEKDILGFSFNERIIQLTEKISSVHSIEIPVNEKRDQYLGNTVRVLEPNKPAFPAHTDKYVHDINPKARHLNTLITPENLISYFAVLKNTCKGGRLYLFNKYYSDTPHQILEELTSGDFKKVQKYIYRNEVIKIDLEEGDLILFNAGNRWHLVEPIYGPDARITVGSFTSYNKNKDKIYIWS